MGLTLILISLLLSKGTAQSVKWTRVTGCETPAVSQRTDQQQGRHNLHYFCHCLWVFRFAYLLTKKQNKNVETKTIWKAFKNVYLESRAVLRNDLHLPAALYSSIIRKSCTALRNCSTLRSTCDILLFYLLQTSNTALLDSFRSVPFCKKFRFVPDLLHTHSLYSSLQNTSPGRHNEKRKVVCALISTPTCPARCQPEPERSGALRCVPAHFNRRHQAPAGRRIVRCSACLQQQRH